MRSEDEWIALMEQLHAALHRERDKIVRLHEDLRDEVLRREAEGKPAADLRKMLRDVSGLIDWS